MIGFLKKYWPWHKQTLTSVNPAPVNLASNPAPVNFAQVILFGTAVMLLLSCRNDIETINALATELRVPDQIAYDVETVFHDSGIMQGKILAPEINIFDNEEQPYTEFPQGLQVFFYDTAGQTTASITAGYAIYFQDDRIWEARNKVVAENNVERAKLETEQLFWDEANQKIYSEKFSAITNADGVFYGQNGFDANQDLTNWTLRGSRGTAIVEDEVTDE